MRAVALGAGVMQLLQRRAGRSPRAGAFTRPGRVIAGAFAGAIAVGTGLLSLPGATASGEGASFREALFTATSIGSSTRSEEPR